jgi:hypothetical protein
MRDFKLPQWPQIIRLTPGKAKILAFPVISTGSIRAEVQWDGKPIDLKLIAPDGSIVKSISSQSPPSANLEIDVTAAQLRKGTLWAVEVRLADGRSRIKETPVKVLLAAPPIPLSKYSVLEKRLSSQLKLNDEAMRLLGALLRQLQGDNPPYPIITDIIPGHAYTNQTITIKGQFFGVLNGQNEVWFSVDGDLRSNIAANGTFTLTDEALIVKVPPMIFDPQKNIGTIYVRRIYDDKRSDFKEFVFDPRLKPNILSASPASAREGDLVTLQGENFGSDINNVKAIFVLANGTELPAVIQTAGDTQMTVIVPPYVSNTQTAGQIVIKRKYVADWVNGIPFSFLLLATVAGVSNYTTWNPNLPEYQNADSHTVSPKGYLFIEGVGFGVSPGKVFFRPLPGENVGDTIIWFGDREMNLLSGEWSDNQITVSLPDDSYFPFEAEFYIRTTRPSGQVVDSPPQPIHIRPSYDLKPIEFPAASVDVGAPTASASSPADDDSWSHFANGIAVIHPTDPLSGRRGEDLFFWHTTVSLKNFFVVDHIAINVISNTNKTSAAVATSHPGTNNPALKINWENNVDIGFFSYASYPLSYILTIYLRGPRGYNYK